MVTVAFSALMCVWRVFSSTTRGAGRPGYEFQVRFLISLSFLAIIVAIVVAIAGMDCCCTHKNPFSLTNMLKLSDNLFRRFCTSHQVILHIIGHMLIRAFVSMDKKPCKESVTNFKVICCVCKFLSYTQHLCDIRACVCKVLMIRGDHSVV